MVEKKVTTKNKSGETLVGIETMPDGSQEKYPTVILVHGFGVTKSESGMFDELAARLAEENILSYRFDFSGLGESEGEYIETSLTKLCDDLHSISDFVKNQKYVDLDNIGIHAQSFGTSIAIVSIPDINSIVLTGSFTHLKEIFAKEFGSSYNPYGISERLSRSTGRLIQIGPQFWTDFDNYDLTKSIKKIHCPILFIQGEKDKTCPIQEMEELFRAANEPKEKIILEGAEHSFKSKREEMYQLAVDWFKKTLWKDGHFDFAA